MRLEQKYHTCCVTVLLQSALSLTLVRYRAHATAPWNPYDQQLNVYCIVREPVSRFISNFFFSQFVWPRVKMWPEVRCGPHPNYGTGRVRKGNLSRHSLSAALWCFLDAAEDAISGYAIASERRVLSEFLVHMQPQADYITGDGAAGCSIVFPVGDLGATGITNSNRGHESEAEHQMVHNVLTSNSSLKMRLLKL